jgi:hypothetical protein
MDQNSKIIVGLVCAMLLCILAIAFVLPGHGVSTTTKQRSQTGGQPNGTATNIVNPVTTIPPSTTTVNITTTSTTSISSSGEEGQLANTTNVTQQYIQQLSNPSGGSTTTVLYAYCVGSPTPPFNQSYYAQLDYSGAESWKATTGYPAQFIDGSCASSGSLVYCVGDSSILFGNLTQQAYYAHITPFGIGNWTRTTSYPVPFTSGSCTIYNSQIYCVGSLNQSHSDSVYYATAYSGGIGPWKETTSYPDPFFGGQCNAHGGYIYCIGDSYFNASAEAAYMRGLNRTLTYNSVVSNGGLPPLGISYDYYAPVSASGVGQWKPINPTPVPIDGGSCTISNSTIYCVGGISTPLLQQLELNYTAFNQTYNSSSLSQTFINESSASYYATIGPNGAVGAWTSAAPYPTELQNTQCASNGADIYCVGGSYQGSGQEVFYSALSPTFGIDGWLPTTEYPIPFYSGYCSTNANA